MSPAWDIAKEALLEDIDNGVLVRSMKPSIVYKMRKIYGDVKYENFRTNLNNLWKRREQKQEQSRSDRKGLQGDRLRHPIDNNPPHLTYPRWHGSTAQSKLKTDLAANAQHGLRPLEFQQTRAEYMLFPPKVFRGHVEHILRKEREQSYWLKEKEKKRAKKEEMKEAQKRNRSVNF